LHLYFHPYKEAYEKAYEEAYEQPYIHKVWQEANPETFKKADH
jgi:hypothetical protein